MIDTIQTFHSQLPTGVLARNSHAGHLLILEQLKEWFRPINEDGKIGNWQERYIDKYRVRSPDCSQRWLASSQQLDVIGAVEPPAPQIDELALRKELNMQRMAAAGELLWMRDKPKPAAWKNMGRNNER